MTNVKPHSITNLHTIIDANVSRVTKLVNSSIVDGNLTGTEMNLCASLNEIKIDEVSYEENRIDKRSTESSESNDEYIE